MASIELDLERLALFLEEALGLVARHHCLREWLVARDDLAHALLDRREILRGERLGAVEIVVETVLDHRTDRHLSVRPQRLHRVGEHMRRVVADKLEGARIVAADELEARVPFNRVGEVDERAVAHRRDRAFGERRRDGFGDLEAGDARLKGALRAVRKGDVNHGCSRAHSPKPIGVSETRMPIDAARTAEQSSHFRRSTDKR